MPFDSSSVFREFPLLDAGKVALRHMHVDDAEDFYRYHQHPEIRPFIAKECFPETIERALEEIRYNQRLFSYEQSIYWAIAEKETNRLIGSCGFNYWNRSHDRAEISYDLSYHYWGRGIVSGAVSVLLDYGFSSMGLRRIEATVSKNNAGSVRVLEKNGFILEGTLRQQKYINGAYQDMDMYSVLSDARATEI